MADFFTTVSVAPVDKATTTQKTVEDQVPSKLIFSVDCLILSHEFAASVVSHQTDAAPPKATGSNFSMCEIIM